MRPPVATAWPGPRCGYPRRGSPWPNEKDGRIIGLDALSHIRAIAFAALEPRGIQLALRHPHRGFVPASPAADRPALLRPRIVVGPVLMVDAFEAAAAEPSAVAHSHAVSP